MDIFLSNLWFPIVASTIGSVSVIGISSSERVLCRSGERD